MAQINCADPLVVFIWSLQFFFTWREVFFVSRDHGEWGVLVLFHSKCFLSDSLRHGAQAQCSINVVWHVAGHSMFSLSLFVFFPCGWTVTVISNNKFTCTTPTPSHASTYDSWESTKRKLNSGSFSEVCKTTHSSMRTHNDNRSPSNTLYHNFLFMQIEFFGTHWRWDPEKWHWCQQW